VKSLHRRLAVLLGSLLCACERSAPNGSYTLPWDVREHVTIGVEAGDPTAEFGRIAGVVKLPDGSIAVADGGNAEVRIFAADGTYQRTVGRRGAGPGEFSSLTRLVVSGDTLIATPGDQSGRSSARRGYCLRFGHRRPSHAIAANAVCSDYPRRLTTRCSVTSP
jgi:hypothetical protein